MVMKRMMMMMICCLIHLSGMLDAKPRIKGALEVDITFGKRSEKDEQGNCPGKGLCRLKLKFTFEPGSLIVQNGHHYLGLDVNDNLLLIIDKHLININQPDKVGDLKADLYSFTNGNDIIASEITKALHINNGNPILLYGKYSLHEEDDYYIINLGIYEQ